MGQILTTRDEDQAGYFRIGTLVLNIPPEQIQCHKVINGDEVMPLRFPFALPIKTGQSRWDVTWAWKCVADYDNADYTAWKDIQLLLAMFKAAPFVEVENDHIRQIVNPGVLTQGASQDDVMAFALRQMRVDTVPDLIDTLQVTLTMSYFNYRPYSKNFQYDDYSGKPTPSALNSPLFSTYLQNWIETNLNNDPTQQPDTGMTVSSTDWQGQIPGSVTFTAREYVACALPNDTALNPPPPGASALNPANPGATHQGTAKQGNATAGNFVDNITIDTTDITNPAIQWWVKSTAFPESNNNYSAINKSTVTNTGKPSAAVGLLQWVRAAAIDAMKAADTYLGTHYVSTAVQSGYLVSARTNNGYNWGSKTVPNPQSTDPVLATYIAWMMSPPVTGSQATLQNDMATGWAIIKLRANNGSALSAWEAHRFGQGIVNNGQGDPSKDNNWFTKATNTYRTLSGDPNAFTPQEGTTQPAGSPNAATNTTPVVSGNNTNTPPNISDSSNPPPTATTPPPMTTQIRYLLNNRYTYDYATESSAFLYKEHYIKMVDQENDDQPSSSAIDDIDPQHFIYPMQVSVVFVNNISQLPLAGYQYPTYQHLGPGSTLVSIGLLSNADIQEATDHYSEPEHTGLSLMSNMIKMLEDQFQSLRNEWRRVNSIHRMQSVAVKNQILNMLGIRGLLTKELTTETVPESANEVTAQYNAIQYENIYYTDGPNPYTVNTTPYGFSQTWLKILRDGTIVKDFSQDSTLSALVNLAKMMGNPTDPTALQFMENWLLQKPTSLLGGLLSTLPIPNDAYLVATPAAFQQQEQDLMLKLLTENEAGQNVFILATGGGSFIDHYPAIAQRIQTHNELNYSDYFIIKNWPGLSELPDYQQFETDVRNIDTRISAALAANPASEPPLNQLWDQFVGYAYANNYQALRDQMQRAQSSPLLQPMFVTTQTTATPGTAQQPGHSCYLDMGLKGVSYAGRDNNPALYFHNDNADIAASMQTQIGSIVAQTMTSVAGFESATPYASQATDKSRLVQTSTASFQGNTQAILSNVKPSSYTMAKAFPTFKLFLMEDNAQKPFYAYDNFYSYATVLDMEIIRYRDKPDTAVIQISNLLHLLDQHMFDGTPQGRQEARLHAPVTTNLPADQQLAIPAGGVASMDINQPTADAWTLDNRFPQIAAHHPVDSTTSNRQVDNKFPLRYFALQTGTKVQVRMGFSNNPDLLVPVFTGQVTQIEGDEILSIVCQSYMVELVVPAQDEIRKDGFTIDGRLNKLTNALVKSARDFPGNIPSIPGDLLGGIFGNTPAFGGNGTVGGYKIPGLNSPGGTVADVMSAMLSVSTAKHFGRWQLGSPTDHYIKGHNWNTLLGSVLILASNSPLSAGATGLESGYDRSFENILTTHIFGPDGTATADANGGARTWWYEKPGGYGAPEYYIPKDSIMTPWTYIQDIARRYPEFILAVKQYGFPYTADATLVFANPHDFYSSRTPIPGEVEMQQQAASDNTQFTQWWTNGTSSGQAQFKAFCTGVGSQWASSAENQYEYTLNGATQGSAYYTFFVAAVGATLQSPSAAADKMIGYINGGGPGVFFNITNIFAQQMANNVSSFGLVIGTSPGRTISPFQGEQGLQQLVQNYYNWLNQQKQSGGSNLAVNVRMKPVRRWHLVNGDNIVHNGINLNENFYNTVRLVNQTLTANESIPSHYRRMLVADPFIVSKDNIKGDTPQTNAYMQSFLRDELAKAYRGELVLLGNPDIEPFDICMLLDPSTGIAGPVEVDSAIHSFNQETGFITIVRPRAMVVVNDKLSMPIHQAVWDMLTRMETQIEGWTLHNPLINTSNLPVVEAELGILTLIGAAAISPWIAVPAALAGGVALFWTGKIVNRLNPMGMVPLTRFQRPWISGLEGWKVDDVLGTLQTKWQYFKEDEIEPLMYSYRQARNMGLI